jgi:hypothetical protein
MTEWWTSQEAGLIGGIGGSAIGVFGGILGATIGLLAPRGIARPLVLGAQIAMAALGVVLLGAGVYAAATGQPYHVYYPLLLGGLLAAGLMGGLLPVTIGAYARAERNRLSAAEFRRS